MEVTMQWADEFEDWCFAARMSAARLVWRSRLANHLGVAVLAAVMLT